MPAISTFLPEDFLPVYGTNITPESFRWTSASDIVSVADVESLEKVPSHAFVVEAVDEIGKPIRYVIWTDASEQDVELPGDGAHWYCRATYDTQLPESPLNLDAWTVEPRNPYTRMRSQGALLSDWVSEVMLADAEGNRQEPAESWAQDTLDAAFQRIEIGAVRYEDHAIATADFGTPGELQEWFDTTLKATQVRVEVAPLIRYPLAPGNQLQEGMLLRTLVDDEAETYYGPPISTDIPAERWIVGDVFEIGYDRRPTPQAAVRFSGSVITSSQGIEVTSWAELNAASHIKFGLPDRPLAWTPWVLLRLLGTDIAIPLPVMWAHLQVRIDDDGALVAMRVIDAAGQTETNRREDQHRRRWGRWFDEHAVLTEEELHAGRERVEAQVMTALWNEKSEQ